MERLRAKPLLDSSTLFVSEDDIISGLALRFDSLEDIKLTGFGENAAILISPPEPTLGLLAETNDTGEVEFEGGEIGTIPLLGDGET